MGWNDVGGGDVDGVVGVTEVGRSDVGELEGSGAGSMLRASEGWKRGPSAENWFWEGVVNLRPRDELESRGCVCRGESGIEFGCRAPVSEAGRGFVRGAEMPRSSERESCRLVARA